MIEMASEIANFTGRWEQLADQSRDSVRWEAKTRSRTHRQTDGPATWLAQVNSSLKSR